MYILNMQLSPVQIQHAEQNFLVKMFIFLNDMCVCVVGEQCLYTLVPGPLEVRGIDPLELEL